VRWSGWVALKLGEALGVPVLCSVHNVIGLATPVLKAAPLLMAVSDEVAGACIEAGSDPAAVVTVHNRVDRSVFTPEGESAGGPDGSPKLLSVARDVPQKNLDRLLEACTLAQKQHPNLRLVHVGRSDRDWAKWPFAMHLVRVPNRELPAWMRWADALVLPSLWEGFGTVIIEALACGTPVITSNRGCMKELVIDRWDGLHCDPENVPDIARAIGEIADPTVQARLAAPARTASEAYSIEANGRREAALYRWILENERPRVTVVTPTYNRESYVEAAVRSVLDQRYRPLDMVVVNDGSSDGTQGVLDRMKSEYGDRLTVVRQENTGLPGALNAGFAAATGDLLAFSADDDYHKPGALGAMARELALDPAAGMVFADYEWVLSDGTRRVVETGPVEELAQRNVIGLCALFTREAFERTGNFDTGFHLAEDYEFWVRMSRATRMTRLRRVLYEIRDHPGTLTVRRPGEVQEMTLRVQHTHFGAPRDEAAYADQLARLAGAYKAQGMAGKSLGAAVKLIRFRPMARAGWWSALRALTPGPLLRLSRRLRGLRTENS
jgi:GT2 family glycosyltransferase